jgi:ribulose-phosphate 3-epimerase
MLKQIKLAPSILSADFAHLGDQVAQAEAAGADYIHVDVMDGRFVPNITIGPMIVRAVRRSTRLPLDVHLMIVEPERYLESFVQAGANSLTVHVETCPHLHRTIQQIHELGAHAGVALNPATPLGTVEEILGDIDLLLVMTVSPGFGGQTFIDHMLHKIERARSMIDRLESDVELEVDGGIEPHTIPAVVKAGARVLVAGSAVFGTAQGISEAIGQLYTAIARV